MLLSFIRLFCSSCEKVRWHEIFSGFGKCVICEVVLPAPVTSTEDQALGAN